MQFDKRTLHSGNIYQIFTYVKNKEAELKEDSHEVAGMLLYAKTDEEILPDNEYSMSGNKISVKTLDLSRDFASIEEQLYKIAKDYYGDTVDTHFYMKGRGCEGAGVRSGKSGFLLLAGSRVSQKDAGASCPEHILCLREEYADKIQDDILTENVLFHSSSAAVSFLMMVNVNGNLEWKTKGGVHAWVNIERNISCKGGSVLCIIHTLQTQQNWWNNYPALQPLYNKRMGNRGLSVFVIVQGFLAVRRITNHK